MAGSTIFKPGLCSVTFRQLSPAEIVSLAAKAGLAGIEWGGDIHVPHGKLDIARQVKKLTLDAGLQVSSYGSYYRAGVSAGEGIPFSAVLSTAQELGAPTIRVWAGKKASAEATDEYRNMVYDDLRKAGDMAAAANMNVGLEWHVGSLTDSIESVMRLLEAVNHPNVGVYWQPETDISDAQCQDHLRTVLAHVVNVHAFHWVEDAFGGMRKPLVEGAAVWRKYLDILRASDGERWVLMEFVVDDSPEAFLKDAVTLKELLG